MGHYRWSEVLSMLMLIVFSINYIQFIIIVIQYIDIQFILCILMGIIYIYI